MSIIYKEDNNGIDFNKIHEILVAAFDGRPFHEAELIKKAFLGSNKVVYALDDDKLIGCARAISDGEWSVIYNVALLPEYQGKGIGKSLIKNLINQLKGQHIFTYTHPKTVSLYESLGFNRSKQAFKFVGHSSQEALKAQEEIGFTLPYGYRFDEEFYVERVFNKANTKNAEIRYSSDLSSTTFESIVKVLEKSFKRERDLEKTKKEFLASQYYEFAFDGDKLIGCARLVSDGVEYAILLNVAVDPEYQGLGIASNIIKKLADQVKGFNIFIHAHPGSASFYNSKPIFRRYKTAFVYNDGSLLSDERGKRFALPNGFRWPDEYNKEEMKYYKGKIYGSLKQSR